MSPAGERCCRHRQHGGSSQVVGEQCSKKSDKSRTENVLRPEPVEGVALLGARGFSRGVTKKGLEGGGKKKTDVAETLETP